MILGCESMALNYRKSLGRWMTWKTPTRELRTPYAMNNLGLWLTRTSPSHELKALDAMNNSRL